MKVVDASAVIELLTRTDKAERIATLLDDDLFAPDLLVVEVVHYFRFELLGGRLTEGEAAAGVQAFTEADIEYLPISQLASELWRLRHNISAYEAAYLALADQLGAPVVTTDARLAAAPGIGVGILLV